MHSSTRRFVLMIVLAVSVVAPARAGLMSWELVGPAPDGSNVIVRISTTTALVEECFDRCGYLAGGFGTRIEPIPPDLTDSPGQCLHWSTPDEEGVRFSTGCPPDASSGSGVSLRITLDPTVVYTLSDAAHQQTWMGSCQGGVCCADDLCTERDESYPALTIDLGTVSSGPASWSTLKSRY